MKKISTLILAVAALCLVSCVKDFTARNTNQEQANEEMMDHDNMRTGYLPDDRQRASFLPE